MPKFISKRQPSSGKPKRLFIKSNLAKYSSKSKAADPLALLSDVIPEEKYRERDMVIVLFFDLFYVYLLMDLTQIMGTLLSR
jgi:hypothetical protein